MLTESPLERGREAYRRRAWQRAFQELSAADEQAALQAEDLWRLAWAGQLSGREAAFRTAIERAHRAHLDAGALALAARCAVWAGLRLAALGDAAQASGWLGRARRLLRQAGGEHVEHGYLHLSEAQRNLATGAYGAALEAARAATRSAERFADRDLHAFALHVEGVALLRQTRIREGLALLDEAMLAVTADELMPVVSGIVYCSAIDACRNVYAFSRVHEWTTALRAWCEAQPELVPFSGRCMVHRAEIMLLHGAWSDALVEARQAEDRCGRGGEPDGVAAARYAEGEVHRLRGAFAEADEAYREAARLGRDPQPGLALLRLAQGKREAAVGAVGRALGERRGGAARARLLPAAVEVLLGAGDLEGAAGAAEELAAIAEAYGEGALATQVAHWTGAVALARGDATAALVALRRAWRGWQMLEAPYQAARARELVAAACLTLGDGEAAAIELEAARDVFLGLGAQPDVARLDGRAPGAAGLSRRELEVLRLVAGGGSNKAVALALGLSERTVERHLSNIFDKLGVASRTEATAYAYAHGLA